MHAVYFLLSLVALFLARYVWFLAQHAAGARIAKIEADEVELNTTGFFYVVHAQDESNRCGPIGTTRKLSYRAVIRSHPVLLDGQGFIIDWQKIDGVFTEAYADVEIFPSCEEIAARGVADIVKLVGADRCIAVEVSLGSGDMPTGMTARWHHPNPDAVKARAKRR